jgi:hypothetical protein
MVEADAGYYRGDFRVACPNQYRSQQEKHMKKNARARHETVNRRFKQFNCLKSFRHGKELHAYCFNSVAVLTEIGIEYGEPLYSIDYKLIY